MRTKKTIALAMMLLAVHSPMTHAVVLDFDGAEYMATTAEWVTVAWDASKLDDADCTDCTYEVRLYHVERKAYTDAGSTTGLTKTFQLPKSGHYVVEVRGCRPGQCSEWATSVNDENSPYVNAKIRKWRIYGRPAAGGPITITQ